MPRTPKRHKTDSFFNETFERNHGAEMRDYYSTVNRHQFTCSLRFFDEEAAAIDRTRRTARHLAAE
jgi:hypothetical protein